MFQLTILCLCLPSLILAVPANDEVLKQQIASDLLKNDESPYWNLLRPGMGGAKLLRRLDTLGGNAFGFQNKRFDSLSGRSFGHDKRNFDEIDNAGFGAFVKRNFDEIDNVGMGFKKRERQFDEIDNAGFGAFIKRN
ncbi:unnamed protein product [Allacma fusca]|uniref:Orcokinin n=1 Tax=Allacma fusca TaxID=39272 RepID=A0A8J2LUH0_9HEXA|nr:unnamed protein product [Allacma fusca]